jgi:GTPase Era involved in 16S rRNA processing
MYDIVLDIDNLIDLEEGWKIYFAQRLLSRIEGAAVMNKPLDPETVNNLSLSTTKVVVSVLGLFNKGKTFLLNKICNENFDSGYKVTTRGLSFKEPYDMNNIILLDTAGTSSPLQSTYMSVLFSFTNPDPVKNPKSTLAVKKSTEDFLQKMSFLLSDIIIVVVNELTWPDQEYMTALAEQVRERPNDAVDNKIIVVHNYKDAETIEDYLIMRQVR